MALLEVVGLKRNDSMMGTQLPEPLSPWPSPTVPFLGSVTVTVPALSPSASTFPAILVSPDSAAPFFGSFPAFCPCTELDQPAAFQHIPTKAHIIVV